MILYNVVLLRVVVGKQGHADYLTLKILEWHSVMRYMGFQEK